MGTMATPRTAEGDERDHHVAVDRPPSTERMVERATMFRRWAKHLPAPAAVACRRHACELTLMAEVGAAAG
jgi:hypothetical protein